MIRLLSTALGLATVLPLAAAHTSFTTLSINDVSQGDGTCVRQPHNSGTSTNPVLDLSSTDMVCGRDGLAPVAFTCAAPQGAKLSFLWRENPDGSRPGAIDKSHKGPCAVYLKRMSATGAMDATPAEGGGWFKLWHEGYDSAAGKWCTEKLMAASGLMSVDLPASLPGGAYLVRAELLALHNAAQGEPQFYIGCAQVFVAGPASPLAIPADREATIPGYASAGSRAVSLNIYTSNRAAFVAYAPPGPAPWTPSGSGTGSGAAVQTAGLIPANCVVVNANWCGTDVARYTNEAGCWRAADACSRQEGSCYTAAPPSGEAGCRVFAKRCAQIQRDCGAGRWRGPPAMEAS